MTVHFHEEDLPEGVTFADGPIAVDTETLGLITHRDRLCLIAPTGSPWHGMSSVTLLDIADRLREPRMTGAGYSGVLADGASLTLSAAEAVPLAAGARVLPGFRLSTKSSCSA